MCLTGIAAAAGTCGACFSSSAQKQSEDCMENKNSGEILLEIKDLSISFFNKSGEVQAVRTSAIH